VLPALRVPLRRVPIREVRLRPVAEGGVVTGSASRRRGSRAELAVVHALRRAGWQADTSRNVLDGRRTGDDVVWDGPVSIEVKDVARLDLSGWLRQATDNAGDRPAAVWHKKRGTADAEGWYVTMTGEDFLRLIGRAR
jgi:hypothetical protein